MKELLRQHSSAVCGLCGRSAHQAPAIVFQIKRDSTRLLITFPPGRILTGVPRTRWWRLRACCSPPSWARAGGPPRWRPRTRATRAGTRTSSSPPTHPSARRIWTEKYAWNSEPCYVLCCKKIHTMKVIPLLNLFLSR